MRRGQPQRRPVRVTERESEGLDSPDSLESLVSEGEVRVARRVLAVDSYSGHRLERFAPERAEFFRAVSTTTPQFHEECPGRPGI